MLAPWIVEHLDIVEHVLSGFGARRVVPAPYPFAFEQIEEALRNCVVATVAAPAHRVFEIVRLEE